MKRITVAFAALLTVTSTSMFSIRVWAQAPADQALTMRWDYMVLPLTYGDPANTLEERLDRLGNDGWEVVAATSQNRGGATVTDSKIILKRPRK